MLSSMRFVFVTIILSLIMVWPSTARAEEGGRWVDFGYPFNAIAQCEAGPTPWNPNDGDSTNNDVEVVAISDSGKGDYGIFQFRQPTWDWVNGWLGRWDLVGVRPNRVPIADQYEAAKALAYEIPGGGLQHWSTWKNGCAKKEAGPRYVTFEQAKPEIITECLDTFRDPKFEYFLDSVLVSPYYIIREIC